MTTASTELTLPEAHQVKQNWWGSDFESHFWERVDRSAGPDGCWPWTRSTLDTGYGCVWAEGKPQKAHRIAWRLTHGEIPSGARVLHHCDNPPCCNPDDAHLFLGTPKDNTADMLAKGRGNRHGRQVLSIEQRAFIRDRYAAGGVSLKDLGAEHGVSWVAIWKVVHRVTGRDDA